MASRVFLYSVKNERHNLYVGSLSTSEGLSLFPPEETVSIVRFGATNYKNYGWATEEHLPDLCTVQELRNFLTQSELGLIDFEVKVGSSLSLSTHDDSECNFALASRPMFIAAVQLFAPPSCAGALINALLNNTEAYVECAQDGQIRVYATFDEYLASRT